MFHNSLTVHREDTLPKLFSILSSKNKDIMKPESTVKEKKRLKALVNA